MLAVCLQEGFGRQPAKNAREVRQDAPWRHAQAEEVKSWEDHRGCCEADEEYKVVTGILCYYLAASKACRRQESSR